MKDAPMSKGNGKQSLKELLEGFDIDPILTRAWTYPVIIRRESLNLLSSTSKDRHACVLHIVSNKQDLFLHHELYL